MSEAAAPSRPPPVFSPIVVLWMVLAAVFSASAFLVLSAYAPELRGASDLGAHALSRSAVGYAGVRRLLAAEGQTAVISRAAPNARNPAWSLMVLTPDLALPKDLFWDLATRGPTLIVAPKWEAMPDPTHPGWVDQVGLIDAKAIQTMLDPQASTVVLQRRADTSPAPLIGLPGVSQTGIRQTGPIESFQTFQSAPHIDALVTDARGGIVLAASKDRRLFFLSDPDLLNNHGLASLANAQAATSILAHLRKGGGPIAFDVTLNGFGGSPSLLKLAFSPPFLGATLCLAAVGLLIGLCAATTFGAPRRVGRALAFGKRALADNSAGLIRLARREPKMAPRYLDLTRAAVVKALGAGRAAPDDLDAILDRMAERGGVKERLAALGPQARNARTVADLMKVARALYQWRVEMTGEHR